MHIQKMDVVHSLGFLSIGKSINENAGFLLTNKEGSYCSFFCTPSSRYHGFFYFDKKAMNMYKFIESIELAGNNCKNNVSSLKNGFYFIERRKDAVTESFLMPRSLNSLMYELSQDNEIDLILDCKASYDNREMGRFYDISEENIEEKGCILIKFTKRTDKREDQSHGLGEFSLYLAIKSKNNAYKVNNKWTEREYSYDKERNSSPFKRHVYNALRLNGSRFVFSIAKDRRTAVKECIYVFEHFDKIKYSEKISFQNLLNNSHVKKTLKNRRISNASPRGLWNASDKKIKIAYICALNSLSNLAVNSDSGVIAGLPWFFQFWARDTLISLKSMSKINKNFSKKVLFDYLGEIDDYGRLPNLIGEHAEWNLGSADSHGWLFFRCKEIIEEIAKNKRSINSIKKSLSIIRQNKNPDLPKIKEYLKNCNSIIRKRENEYDKIIYEVESSLESSLNALLKYHTKDAFEVNNAKETWMDTEFDGDSRKGARIEVQALRLNMYKLMFELTQNQKYKILENMLKIKVRQQFFNGKIVADGIKDGLSDFTIRPNLFIAAYAYPEFLSAEEWETCFDNALKALWLDWGGLSTIDKNNPLFTNESTGEDVKSYHRGDSWFWLNNLAALVLHKINKAKFKKQIQKIISASTEEILWKGCVGCHAELSSAKNLESKGCFAQAWSNSMYVELMGELFQ